MNLSSKYRPDYVDQTFFIWYQLGKPNPRDLWDRLPIDQLTNEKPTIITIREWMSSEEWIERAISLDSEVEKRFREKQIQAKVEMLERHAEIGRQMQEISSKWLKENIDKLTPGTAVKMLVDGIGIEQATAGIPEALKKMITMKDEDVLEEITKLLADTPSDYDANY